MSWETLTHPDKQSACQLFDTLKSSDKKLAVLLLGAWDDKEFFLNVIPSRFIALKNTSSTDF